MAINSHTPEWLLKQHHHLRMLLRRRYAEHSRGYLVFPGWAPLIYRLNARLEILCSEYRLVECYNEFGVLRYCIEYPPNDELANQLWMQIAEAEVESLRTCDLCASPARGRESDRHGRARTRCDGHADTNGSAMYSVTTLLDDCGQDHAWD